MKFRLFSILLVSVFLSCKKKILVPNTLDIAFQYLDKNWHDDQRLGFSDIVIKEVTPVYYDYAIENDLQQNLLNNHEASVKLNAFFDSLGVYRVKDKSGLILNTYHNYINSKQLNLQKQVDEILNYWQPIEDCQNQINKKALDAYHQFSVNDMILIRLPVDEHNNAIDYNCPKIEWKFKSERDLEITATLLNKFVAEDSLSASFQLKLKSKNKNDTEILYQELDEGDTFTISLFNSWKIRNVN
ncbi:DUF6794 domain-containing protein [Winogradskyella sp. 4-2091]|uniref:DUF6794 domain-containing protein n=1 Tax=Winogradskyella sp. 4-2091 TaxID=3381659 RepID=UPI003892C55E